jgi:hypothetical protein
VRPSVFALFFLIFSSALVVWFLNSSNLQHLRDSFNLSSEPKSTAIKKITNEKSKTSKDHSATSLLQKRLGNLESQVAIISDSSRLDRLEATLAEQQLKLNLLKEVKQIRVESGAFLAKKGAKQWKLANMFSKKRVLKQRIYFPNSFTASPKVVLGITTIELTSEKNRLRVNATKIDKAGFTINFETKSDTRIGEVNIDWAAFGY